MSMGDAPDGRRDTGRDEASVDDGEVQTVDDGEVQTVDDGEVQTVDDGEVQTVDRRTVLQSLAAVGMGSLAGCSLLEAESDTGTTQLSEERASELAEQFAPTIYFDAEEQWFPTDPRPYESTVDGETVIDGFDAFDGYAEQVQNAETPPAPAAFYRAVQYEGSPLGVVQYWFYSTFDQFTANFHWHDWEVLHVFVDLETDDPDPQLYVASSHSRKVPNNEFLDPDPERLPTILSELGSHSSALSVNERRDRFHRIPSGDLFADITNSTIEGIEDIAAIPVAYGLPRGEGFRLPYVIPELDDEPLYEHPDLPAVSESDLISGDLAVRSFQALTSPPTDLPERENGVIFQPETLDPAESSVAYDLIPASEIEHITAFTGPQLSFEFYVPQFAEDAVAGHLTSTGVPWAQERYDNPAADISDPNHRLELADRYDVIGEPPAIDTIVAQVTNAVTTEDAPEDQGLTTEESAVESVALLESDPEAVPTFNGLAIIQDVPEGDHTLTVNAAGNAPHSEPVTVAGSSDEGDDDSDNSGTRAPTIAGADGEIPLVANEHATKLEVDTEETDTDLSDLAIEDDFAGRIYDAPLKGREAVYVHKGGAYTTEVRDVDDEVGAYRINPADRSGERIDRPDTGKAPLATFLADISEETRAQVAAVAGDGDTSDDTTENGGSGGSDSGGSDSGGSDSGGQENAIQGLEKALAAVRDAARRAAERAKTGDGEGADKNLQNVADRLERVSTRLAEAKGDLPDGLGRAAEKRLAQANRRAEQAQNAEKLGN